MHAGHSMITGSILYNTRYSVWCGVCCVSSITSPELVERLLVEILLSSFGSPPYYLIPLDLPSPIPDPLSTSNPLLPFPHLPRLHLSLFSNAKPSRSSSYKPAAPRPIPSLPPIVGC